MFAGGALLLRNSEIVCRDGTRGNYTLWADTLEKLSFSPELIKWMAAINDEPHSGWNDVGKLAGKLGDRKIVLDEFTRILPPVCG